MHMTRFSAGLLSALLLLGASQAQAQSVNLALDSPPSYDVQPTYRWAKNFTDKLAEEGFKTELFAYNSIGGEAERFDQLRAGLLNVDMAGYAFGVQLVPEMEVVRLPYVFDDMDHLARFISDSDFLEKVNEKMAPSGARVLAIVPLAGFMGIFNDEHPVASKADLSGIRLRALDASQMNLIKALGADGVVIPFSEVPSALQTGVADGYINPVNVPLTFGHGDLLKYYTNAEIMVGARLALASEQWWDDLSDAEKAKVQAAVDAANADLFDWAASAAAAEGQKLKDAGFEITELSPDARAEFVAATQSMRDTLDVPNKDAYLAEIEAAKK